MGEVTINPKALEDAMLKALPSLFPNLLGTTNSAHVTNIGTTNSARIEFYDKFKRVADEHDRDFIKKYDEDMNTTLIFAGLFSAVTSAFIIDVQSNLQPDFQQMSYTLLTIIARASLGNVPTGADAAFPQWNGPDPTVVHIQAILYTSLAASLLAAFIAMLGKQWINRYAQVEMRGSVIDRSRDRQRKMNGMVTWHFDLVMECLPLMLQIALLLLGYALSDYLFFINKVVASVLIGFTTFGLLFYFLIISAATLSYNCPFQTPLSLILRFLIRFDSDHKKYLKRSRKWFRLLFSRERWLRQTPGDPHHLGAFNGSGRNSPVDHFEVPIVGPPNQSPSPSTVDTDWSNYVIDATCIAWMFEMSVDMDFIMAIMKFIPEVVWHTEIQSTPLQRLYDILVGCFEFSSGHPIVIPKLRDRAYLSAKAVLHLAIQRGCVRDGSDQDVFDSILHRHHIMGSKHYKDDSDLESTLGVIDCVFGKSEPMRWQDFSFTVPHHTWMGHILLYRAWDALEKNEDLPEDIKEFIHYSIHLESPPTPIIRDCFFLACSLLGVRLERNALSVVDKSSLIEAQAIGICKKLEETFGNPTPDDIDHTLKTLAMIYCLPNIIPSSVSYKVFQMVMQSPIPEIHLEAKWKVARLIIHSAFEDDKQTPWVDDPNDILTFLDHHFKLAIISGQNQDQPIQSALHALASASGPAVVEALNHFDLTGRVFIRGICHAFQCDRPSELRKAALMFLPLIGDSWFNPCTLIMGSTEINSFCMDWASTVDCLEPTPAIQKASFTTLLGMINSPRWRPHIPPEKWTLLECFKSVPGDLQSLQACTNDPTFIDEVRKVDNPRAMVLWAEILWFKCGELVPDVWEQLKVVTKEIARNERGTYLGASQSHTGKYLSNTNSELRKAEDDLRLHALQPGNPVDIALRERVRVLQQACNVLDTIRLGKTL